jgi:hypothetical protein
MKVSVFSAVLCSIIAATGCATNFTGSAHIEGGRATCEKKCAGQGLTMSGLIYMGEYSSACVCGVPGASASVLGNSSAVAAGAAGVIMQMRASESSGGVSISSSR